MNCYSQLPPMTGLEAALIAAGALLFYFVASLVFWRRFREEMADLVKRKFGRKT